jgi:glycosyltransferase involved in cell wall biosynthesis
MIRVLHTIDTGGPGGAETVFVNLIKDLGPELFKSFAAIKGPGWVSEEIKKLGIEPIFVRSEGRFSFKYLIELVQIVRSKKIDVIQSHLLGSNVYSSMAGLVCGIPVISTFHGFVDASGNDKLLPIKSRIINLGSKKIVFVSDGLRESFIKRQKFLKTKSTTIYNGVDTSVFKPQKGNSVRQNLGLTSEEFLFGSIGNIRPSKGYEYLLRAARLVVNEMPRSRFVIAGEGDSVQFDELLALRTALDLDNYCFFLGFRSDTSVILNNLDVFVLPSISEGFSISTIEAMACELPVVVTKSGGPEEIVENNVNGFTVLPQDHEELANKLLDIVDDKKLRDRCATNGRCLIEEKFSKAIMVGSYKDIYLEVCDKK